MNRRTRYLKEKKGLIPKIRTMHRVFDKEMRLTKEHLAYSQKIFERQIDKYKMFGN